MSSDQELEALRMKIADLDLRIVRAVAQRMRLASKIGRIKSMKGLDIESREVEEIVLKRARDKAAELGLEQELVDRIFALLIDYSKRQQRKEVDNAPHRDLGA